MDDYLIQRKLKMKSKLNLIFSSIIIGLLLVISGCSRNDYSSNPSGGGATPGPNEVWMQGMSFYPAAKTISSGTTITWTNKDNYPHTVTSGVPGAPDGLFNSGNMNGGATFSYKFNSAGIFKYYCIIHGAMMTATMTVQ
jgi:plastocyanin